MTQLLFRLLLLKVVNNRDLHSIRARFRLVVIRGCGYNWMPLSSIRWHSTKNEGHGVHSFSHIEASSNLTCNQTFYIRVCVLRFFQINVLFFQLESFFSTCPQCFDIQIECHRRVFFSLWSPLWFTIIQNELEQMEADNASLYEQLQTARDMLNKRTDENGKFHAMMMSFGTPLLPAFCILPEPRFMLLVFSWRLFWTSVYELRRNTLNLGK